MHPKPTEQNSASPTGAQQASSASPETLITSESTPESKPLTKAEIENLITEQATRISQSMVDKAESRISRKAQEQIKAVELSRSTLGLTDEQVMQAKQRILIDDMTATQSEQASFTNPQRNTTQNQQAEQQSDELHPVIQETLDTFEAEGISINDDDPEYAALEAILKQPEPNIFKYRQALYKQIETKRARITTNDANAAARVIGGGQINTPDPNDIRNITDSKTLYKMGAKRTAGTGD